ncbi:MAG: hypothetical protein JWM96_782 [Alphaproteobacteria bacterium]|nr:hypothetical protein [Alphaproteobacteria bacterium]
MADYRVDEVTKNRILQLDEYGKKDDAIPAQTFLCVKGERREDLSPNGEMIALEVVAPLRTCRKMETIIISGTPIQVANYVDEPIHADQQILVEFGEVKQMLVRELTVKDDELVQQAGLANSVQEYKRSLAQDVRFTNYQQGDFGRGSFEADENQTLTFMKIESAKLVYASPSIVRQMPGPEQYQAVS